jgi:hypothetical protein
VKRQIKLNTIVKHLAGPFKLPDSFEAFIEIVSSKDLINPDAPEVVWFGCHGQWESSRGL